MPCNLHITRDIAVIMFTYVKYHLQPRRDVELVGGQREERAEMLLRVEACAIQNRDYSIRVMCTHKIKESRKSLIRVRVLM